MNPRIDEAIAPFGGMVLALICAIAPRVEASPVMYVPGWTIKSLALLPAHASPEGITVDGAGNVYVCAASSGIYRIDSSGSVSVWSTASGNGQGMLANGEAYVPSRGLIPTDHIWHVMPNGSYTSLAGSVGVDWTWAAVTPSRKLYANVWAGPGVGLYSVDPSTGAYTKLVDGGPGPGGNGSWFGMTNDGETVYIAGSSDGDANFAIYSWDGTNLGTFAVTSSDPLYVLCIGPNGIYGTGAGPGGGAVYRVTASGASLFASGFGGTVGVAFDPGHQKFYVLDQAEMQVWVISKDITPTHKATWGQVHVRYR